MMKRLQSIARFLIVGGVCVSSLCWLQQAQAATGFCRALDGTKEYNFNFQQVFSDPAINIAGRIIANADNGSWSQSNSTSFPVACDCQNPPYVGPSFISASSPLPQGGPLINNMKAHILNDYLSVAAEVVIGGFRGDYVSIPFENESNNSNTSTGQLCTRWNYLSGSKGRIHLYFRRPFVGTVNIPKTAIVDVSASTISGVKSPTNISRVYMEGSVTVPQNCEINPSPIVVDFGEIAASNFKTAGAKPTGFSVRNQPLTLACRNISDGVKVSLTIQPSATGVDPRFPDALKTTNDDIAVRIEDRNGAIISPISGHIPVSMGPLNGVNSTGLTEMNLYPINTTNNTPAVGVFTAEATVKVEIE
ncbi:fimbrial protein [Chania multitudinisentens]|uniref:fimbrial protein n=1 Tax=Chania multitudinisentens TaxID=1639108 RepID=UPI0012B5630E|nr:fimbrial protein [Chania multitudinisentens]